MADRLLTADELYSSLYEIESNPEFKKLSYQDQVTVRASWADDMLKLNADFVSMSPQDQVYTYRSFVEAKPIFENPDEDLVKWANETAEKILAGDEEAKEEAKRRLILTESTRSSVVGNIVAGATSLVEGGASYSTIYGRDGQKINAMLMAAINASPTTTAQEIVDMEGWMQAGAVAVNLVEAAVMSVGLVGTMGKAGVLTRGLMGPEGRIAKAVANIANPVAYKVASELGEQAVQSTLMGVISTAQNGLIMAFQNPEVKRDWSDVAKYLGQEVAFDWIAWAGLTPAIISTKAIWRSLSGFDKSREAIEKVITGEGIESFQNRLNTYFHGGTMDEGLAQSIKNIDPQLWKSISIAHNRYKATIDAAKNGLETPEARAKVIGFAAGYDVSLNPGTNMYEVRSLIDDTNVYSFGTADEAINYARVNSSVEPTGFMEGRAEDIVLQRGVKTKFNPATQYSGTQTRKFLTPVKGRVLPENAKFFVRNIVQSSGAAKDIGEYVGKLAVVEDTEAFLKANVADDIVAQKMTLPLNVTTPEMEVKVRDYLYRYAKEVSKIDANKDVLTAVNQRIDVLNQDIAKTHLFTPGSLESLKYVSNTHLGIPVSFSESGGKIKIGEMEFSTPGAAFTHVYKQLLDSGKLDFDATAQLIKNVSGFKLDVETGKQPGIANEIKMYAIRDAKGAIVDTDTNLGNLINKVPQIQDVFAKPRMPDYLGPTTWIVDASNGSAVIKDGVAIGSLTELSKLADNFFNIQRTGKKGYKFVDDIDGKSVALNVDKQLYTMYDPDTGIEKSFKSKREATDWIKKRSGEWLTLKQELDARGYSTLRGARGEVLIIDSNAKVTTLRNAEDVKAFMQEHPLPGSAAELLEVDVDTLNKIDADNAMAVDEANHVSVFRQKLNSILRSPTISQIVLPTESWLEDIAKKYKNDAPLLAWRKFMAGMRVVNAKNAEAGVIIDGIWKNVPRKDYALITGLLNLPESEWVPQLQSIGRELTPELKSTLDKARMYYDATNKAFGMQGAHILTSYTPHVLDHMAKLQAKGVEPPTNVKEMLRDIFGENVPNELSFFAENMRRDVFMEAIMDTNPYRTMQKYTDQLHKKTYLGDALDVLNKTYKETLEMVDKGGLPKSAAAYFRDSVLEVFGHRTTLGKTFQEQSLNLSTRFYNKFVKKIAESPAFKDMGIKESIINDDIISKLGSYFTKSTQAGRFWAIPRNLTQVALLGAVTGNKQAWESFAYVVSHPEYIDDIIKRGWFGDSLYTGHDIKNSPTRSLIELSMNPLENSDIITRATAHHTAETLLDKAIRRYRRGIIGKAQFLDEISADILDETAQKNLLNMIDTGQDLAAKDILGGTFNNETMFKYSRGQQGTAFRGVAGRLFGKLGVYPIGALSLYRDIVTRGSGIKAISRAARLVATTTAIYWAFNSVGIDYRGFLWSDPFEFSGGPYWVMLNDLIESAGNQQDSAMARARLFNNIIRTTVPSTFRYMWDAGKYMAEGRTYEAFMSLATAPMSKELKETGTLQYDPFAEYR